MQPGDLQATAEVLLDSHLDTEMYKHRFVADHDQQLPTAQAMVHHLRSVVMSRLLQRCDRFVLDPKFVQSGRVRFTDVALGRTFQLRSERGLEIEIAQRPNRLFDVVEYIASPITLLIYSFTQDGLALSIAGAHQVKGHDQVVAAGDAEPVGFWPFIDVATTPTFDQGYNDAFEDLDDETGEEPGEAGK